ncbi:MAG: class I SAM-dependent methyltransferase [Alphaproteobacteria bacterium]|nr:class I SAM-dependent methyltransferase [Alphaproteobacteria bacterium]
MSGFSTDWLDLREPVDARSRDAGVARALADRLGSKTEITVVDLGSGTGANLRATAALLGERQRWTLVDYDPLLLHAARARLSAWSDRAQATPDELVLHKGGRQISVRFRQADLMRGLDDVLGKAPDLVTASSLFDLCSARFIEGCAAAVARRKAAFYTVLSFDGVQTWTPGHPADGQMHDAFIAHQKTDKGFGVAAGPDAGRFLKSAFERHAYAATEGPSPWRLGSDDAALVRALADGTAGAVAETQRVDSATLTDWSRVVRTGGVVGHIDTLALPGAS